VVVGIDPSEASVQVATNTNNKKIQEGKVSIIQSGVSSIPFGDGEFDLALACDTCYFCPILIKTYEK
jgi:ubiquinone/menaquinone biosynthesis C-methylase UbiE